MNAHKLRYYIPLVLAFAGIFFSFETLQLVLALERQPAFHYYIIPVLIGASFGFLIARLYLLNTQVKQTAITDHLTGLHNRKWMTERFEEQIGKYRRFGISLSALLIDIDYFKQINDRHGHNVGDEILRKLADLIKESSRGNDLCCRWGGEEFLLLLPNTTLVDAHGKAESIRQLIAGTGFDPVGSITCSIGVAELNSQEQQAKDLIKAADERLYEAKHAGRNRVCPAIQH